MLVDSYGQLPRQKKFHNLFGDNMFDDYFTGLSSASLEIPDGGKGSDGTG